MTLTPSVTAISTGLLVARLVFGFGLAAHGAQKLFGWFGGGGRKGTGAGFESLGFRPGVLFATMAGLGEFGGGMLLALGFLGSVGPALMVVVMLTAMIVVHRGKGFFVTNNGVELPLLYAAGAVAIAFTGPGEFSLDRALGLLWLWTPKRALIALAVAIVVALANVAVRRKPAAAVTSS